MGQCPAAAALGNYSGVNFPGHIGPFPDQVFPTDMGIRSVAAFAWTPLMQLYDTTLDLLLLEEKVYPYLRGIVDFYVNPARGRSYLVRSKTDGLLHVPFWVAICCGDSMYVE